MRAVSTVEHLVRTPEGDIGGLILGDGTIIDTPLHYGDTLKSMLRRGDEIQVEGEPRQSRRGRLRLRARKIVRPSGRPAEQDDAPRAVEAQGIVRRFLVNAAGSVNGFRLADGTIIRTPRRQSAQIIAHVKSGDEVRIEGRWSVTPRGHERIIADVIHIVQHNDGFERDSHTEIIDRGIALLRREKAIILELRAIQDELDARQRRRSEPA